MMIHKITHSIDWLKNLDSPSLAFSVRLFKSINKYEIFSHTMRDRSLIFVLIVMLSSQENQRFENYVWYPAQYQGI